MTILQNPCTTDQNTAPKHGARHHIKAFNLPYTPLCPYHFSRSTGCIPPPTRVLQQYLVLKAQYIYHWLAHRVGWVICWFGAKFMWQLEYECDEPFPQEGPVLLLSNHTAVYDPIWVAWGGWRPMHYMASQQLFRFKLLGAVVSALGAFPKTKFTHDPRSIATLEQLYADGRSIVLFPEGTRTWDGRLAPLRRGIGRLVKRLDARVVICRVKTGHLHRPRWAHHSRRLPVKVHYSAPQRFPQEMSAEEITDAIADAIRIDPDAITAPPGSHGKRLAEGLPAYLWACPACFELEALIVDPADADCITCSACEASWRLDVSNRLHALDDAVEDTAVHRAAEALEDHFGDPAAADPQAFADDGVVLRCPDMHIGAVPRKSKKVQTVVRGEATLYGDRLVCQPLDGEPWELALADVKAVSIEVQSVLQLRTQDCLYQLDPAGESNIKWAHFLRPWHRLARQSSPKRGGGGVARA